MCKIFYYENHSGSVLHNNSKVIYIQVWTFITCSIQFGWALEMCSFIPLNSEWDMVLDYGPIHMRFFVFTVNLDPTLYVTWLAFISQDALS